LYYLERKKKKGKGVDLAADGELDQTLKRTNDLSYAGLSGISLTNKKRNVPIRDIIVWERRGEEEGREEKLYHSPFGEEGWDGRPASALGRKKSLTAGLSREGEEEERRGGGGPCYEPGRARGGRHKSSLSRVAKWFKRRRKGKKETIISS